MIGPLGSDNPAQRDADDLWRWPAGLSPQLSDLSASSDAVVNAAPSIVFGHLIAVSHWEQDFTGIRDVRAPSPPGADLEPGMEFEFEFDGLRLCARVIEFVASHRLAWSGQGIDIDVYQAWLVSGDATRSWARTGFAARGAAAIALREMDPGRVQRTLDRWLADLTTAAETATR
jgi:hypothetical protein